jgi:hypothetical protein
MLGWRIGWCCWLGRIESFGCDVRKNSYVTTKCTSSTPSTECPDIEYSYPGYGSCTFQYSFTPFAHQLSPIHTPAAPLTVLCAPCPLPPFPCLSRPPPLPPGRWKLLIPSVSPERRLGVSILTRRGRARTSYWATGLMLSSSSPTIQLSLTMLKRKLG